jgi:hypothetical protein
MAGKDSIPLKRCTKCRSDKPLGEFHKNRSKRDGLATECKPCVIAKVMARYAADPDAHRERMKASYRANPDLYKARAKSWQSQNLDKKRAWSAAARAADPERHREYSRKDWAKHAEQRRAAKKAYRAANPARGAEQVRARQTRQQRAMPVWANRDAIREIYAECRRISEATGIKHHVDHFYPLKGETVCGLHNEFNLQVIPAKLNQSKHNKVPDAI